MARNTQPTRWRLLPTLAVVVVALALGAGSARAGGPRDAGPQGAPAPVTAPAFR